MSARPIGDSSSSCYGLFGITVMVGAAPNDGLSGGLACVTLGGYSGKSAVGIINVAGG